MNKSEFYDIVKKHSMTSIDRINVLFDCLEHIRYNNIEGDMVECGVWEGGNIIGIIKYLLNHKIYDRKIWLYDTFNGLTEPSNYDYTETGGMDNSEVKKHWNQNKINDTTNNWCYSDLDSVKNRILSLGYPENNIFFIVGDVCETLKHNENIPNKLSLLRLDTDWYESTKCELERLYPKLSKNGALIIDDYGYWSGAKKAVNEYYQNNNITFDYKKIDDTGIFYIKN